MSNNAIKYLCVKKAGELNPDSTDVISSGTDISSKDEMEDLHAGGKVGDTLTLTDDVEEKDYDFIIAEIDEYAAGLIVFMDIERAAGVFVDAMRSMVIAMIVCAIIICFAVMYLMQGVMIDRASYGISLLKTFGYRAGAEEQGITDTRVSKSLKRMQAFVL